MTNRSEDPRLERLVELVVQLASGDLTARLEPSAASDAVDAVITGVNMLAGELEVLYAGLEQRVAERTAMLERAQAELRELVLTDALTGLANRTLLSDRIEQSVALEARGAPPPSVLLLDLDGFKAINDTLGHTAGDVVLVEVADRLRAVARRTDTVARLGGDEFAVLITEATEDVALRVAERALAALQMPIPVGERMNWAAASIGLCFGRRGQSADSLLRDADTAMYAAKARGRNNIQVFDPAMHAAALSRKQVADEVRAALTSREFVVHYQPLYELATRRIVGAEALVRWLHPEQGLVSPDAFIPVAEETGLIVELGCYVTQQAVRQLAEWDRTLALPESFGLHVNLSPLQVRWPGLAGFLRDTLAEHAVAGTRLIMEITETGLMTGDAETAQTLDEVRAEGVSLAIDDFGTGYSSISYLRRLPADSVKIDRSLIADIDSDPQQHEVVGAILQLIDAVALCAVAEGIETEEQAARLQALGCGYGQGYLFSPPLPAGEMTRLLRDHVQGSDVRRAARHEGGGPYASARPTTS